MESTEIEVPNLEGLDPDGRDYVNKLEEGLTQVARLHSQQTLDLKNLFHEGFEALKSDLNRVNGVSVEPSIPFEHTEEIDERIVHELRIEAIPIRCIGGRDTYRRVEDAVTESKRVYGDKSRPIKDNLKKLERAGEDFTEAIFKLTKVTPLTDEIDPFNFSLHFYIAHEGNIYEAHFAMEPLGSDKSPPYTSSGPTKNNALREEHFLDTGFLRQFEKQSRGINANAYFVRNPSAIPTPESLLVTGIVHYMNHLIDAIEEKVKQTRHEERDNPVRALINSIKRNTGNYSFKDLLRGRD